MFSPAQALRLEAPMPPMPIAARFSLLLGASCPSTRLGTMAADSAAMAAVDVNCLRETVRVESSLIRESSVATGPPPGAAADWVRLCPQHRLPHEKVALSELTGPDARRRIAR